MNPVFHGEYRRPVLDVYPPEGVPFEKMQRLIREETREPMQRLDEMVQNIVSYRRQHKLDEYSHDHIKRHMLAHSRNMGLSEAEGAGFWGDIWDGIKSVGKSLGQGALNAAGLVAPLLI